VSTHEKRMTTVADAHHVRRPLTPSASSAPLGRAQDLHHDAERDLRALGCHIPVINNCQSLDLAKDASSCGEGVLFMRAPPDPNPCLAELARWLCRVKGRAHSSAPGGKLRTL
jgi:hypothetical protein